MLTVNEASRILGISQARVRQLAVQGALRAEKKGRAWLLDEASVMNRLSAKPQAGRPQAAPASKHDEPAKNTESELHNLYVEGKRLLGEASPSAATLRDLQNSEEIAFLLAMADFFLQQKQQTLVAQRVF